ncbi:MAG: enoyl-CoA hydratase/isomerase family protein [Myxococcota bacterium]
MSDVQLTMEGDVAFLQIASGRPGNPIRGGAFDELRKLSVQLGDSPPGFLVLCSPGPDFSVGLDLDPKDSLMKTIRGMLENRDAYRVGELASQLYGAFAAIGRLPCPILAAVEGHCLGAGFEFALMADIVVAGRDARFGLPGVRDGIVTGLGGLSRLYLALGVTQAQHIALTGRPFTAEAAVRLGLISRVCDAGASLTTVLDVIAELRKVSPAARLQSLLAMREMLELQLAPLLEKERSAAARTWMSGDWQRAR